MAQFIPFSNLIFPVISLLFNSSPLQSTQDKVFHRYTSYILHPYQSRIHSCTANTQIPPLSTASNCSSDPPSFGEISGVGGGLHRNFPSGGIINALF